MNSKGRIFIKLETVIKLGDRLKKEVEYMKKTGGIVWGLWCACTSWITPIWLTLTYLNLSGDIYKYDYSMDEGTAIVFGIVMVTAWLILSLMPSVLLFKRLYKVAHKYAYVFMVAVALLIVVSMAFCGWNVVDFLIANKFI